MSGQKSEIAAVGSVNGSGPRGGHRFLVRMQLEQFLKEFDAQR